MHTSGCALGVRLAPSPALYYMRCACIAGLWLC